jgi:hypothetical protein
MASGSGASGSVTSYRDIPPTRAGSVFVQFSLFVRSTSPRNERVLSLMTSIPSPGKDWGGKLMKPTSVGFVGSEASMT